MTKIALKTEFISRISTFRPSDRAVLANAFVDPIKRDIALDAIKEYVKEWEKASWLEAYSLERIGKWLGKSNPNIAINMGIWAKFRKTAARQALLKGIEVHMSREQLAA